MRVQRHISEALTAIRFGTSSLLQLRASTYSQHVHCLSKLATTCRCTWHQRDIKSFAQRAYSISEDTVLLEPARLRSKTVASPANPPCDLAQRCSNGKAACSPCDEP